MGSPLAVAGIYAAVLNALGLLDGLASLANPASDKVGMEISSTNLPGRIRKKPGERL